MFIIFKAFEFKIISLIIVAAFILFASLIFLAYVPSQQDFPLIISGVTLCFMSYFYLLRKVGKAFSWLLILGIAIRFILIFSFPNFSDDIYRFIWDGKLIHYGLSPYLFIPSDFSELQLRQMDLTMLYPDLNSQEYYSVYPPVSQFFFYLSSFPFFQSIVIQSIVIKSFLFLAEIGTIALGIKLLKHYKINRHQILWYVLNPLIIIEIMGNVHFEGIMIFFFVAFLYFYHLQKENVAIVFLALSIGTKLIPILFLPFFFFQWPIKRFLLFAGKLAVFSILIFLPVLIHLGSFSDSLDLYFRKFEFNASIYFILRQIGFWIRGFNWIGLIGPLLALCSTILVLSLAYASKKSSKSFLLFCFAAFSSHLLLSTTVHPWYLALLIFLGVFLEFRFIFIWSGFIFLSYSRYYLDGQFYYLMIFFEYLVVITWLYVEKVHLDFNWEKLKILRQKVVKRNR